MTEITPNFIHEWKEKHAAPAHKPPFFGGLRTGYLHAWSFVALKVLILAAFFGGFNLIGHIEENVGLLDQYVRNDFVITENFQPVAANKSLKEQEDLAPQVSGEVASAYNLLTQSNLNIAGVPRAGTVAGIADVNTVIGRELDDYIHKAVLHSLVNSIAARFIVPGTGDTSDGCLQIDSLGAVTTKGSGCSSGGGGGSSSGSSIAMGDPITNATQGSVLFAGLGGILAQDNSNFFWDDSDNFLGIGTLAPEYNLDVDGEFEAGDADNNIIRVDGNVALGDIDNNGDGYKLVVSDTTGFIRLDSRGGQLYLGDENGNFNSTSIVIDDAAQVIDFNRFHSAGNFGGYIDKDNHILTWGDGGSDGNNHRFIIDDSISVSYFENGNVGIGDNTPVSALTVGDHDLFQVDSSGVIAAATGVTSSGIITFSDLGGSGTRCLEADNSGTLAVAAAACGSGSGITIGTTTITSGSSGRVLYNNAGVVGEMTTTGSGTTLALSASPTFTGAPVLAAATYTTLAGGTINVSTGNAYQFNSVNVVRAHTANGNYYFGNSGPGDASIGTNNTALGSGALDSMTAGGSNVAIGLNALSGAVTGSDNLALGANAGRDVTSGGSNTFFGSSAGIVNTTASFNVGFGREALTANVASNYNTAIGWRAGYQYNNTIDGINTIIGAAAGTGLTSGVKNTIVGAQINIGNVSSNIALGDGDGNVRLRYTNTTSGWTVVGTGGFNPATTDTVALGTTALMWSDLFLASGAVVNFNNGDISLAHSADTLTVGGGSFATASADLGDGTAGPIITLGRNTNATNTGAGSINFQSKAGTAGYVWQDNAGNMRIHTAAPSNANDIAGTVIGTQASVRSAKQDIHNYTDYAEALQMVADAPLHTYRYRKDVEGYGSNSPLAKERIGYIADEVPGAFMWGNTIDQVSVNGILMASVKALNNKIDIISAQQYAQTGTPPLPIAQPTIGNAPLTLRHHLYLSGDSIGQAKILEGDTSVRINFDRPYQYDPIVTVTPNSRVGSEYWIEDKDSTGFTIYIDDDANRNVTFDWHAFAGPNPKLSVSGGSSSGNTTIIPEPIPEPTTEPDPTPEDGPPTEVTPPPPPDPEPISG